MTTVNKKHKQCFVLRGGGAVVFLVWYLQNFHYVAPVYGWTTSMNSQSSNDHSHPGRNSSMHQESGLGREPLKLSISQKKNSNSSTRIILPQNSNIPNNSSTYEYREPAGAESLFLSAKMIRKRQISKLRERREHLRQVVRQSRWRSILRRNRGQDGKSSTSASTTAQNLLNDDFGDIDIKRAKKSLKLPSWACTDEDEIERVAIMKALCQEELESISRTKISISNSDDRRRSANVNLIEAFPDVYSDFRLLRFLRKDATQNPASAASRYNNFVAWRRQYKVDEIRAQVENAPFSPPLKTRVIADFMPNEFQPNGSPSERTSRSIVLKAGAWQTSEIAHLIRDKKLSFSTFLNYWIYMFESLHLKLYQDCMQQQQMVRTDVIGDLTGLSLSQFSPSFVTTVLRPWLSMTQANYPETTSRILLWNPPRILSVVWGIVAPMASPGTVAKVRLCHMGRRSSTDDSDIDPRNYLDQWQKDG